MIRLERFHVNKKLERHGPGLAISYAVLAFNLFGDGLRDILDPRLTDR